MMRQQGDKVPLNISTEQWINIIKLESFNGRARYYDFLWLNERKKQSKKEKSAKLRKVYLEKKATEPKERPELTTSGPIIYQLSRNSLFPRILDQFIKQIYNLRLLNASMFSSHMIVDCSYEPFMTSQNLSLCAKQILYMWSENRDHINPFHLLFCNLSRDSVTFHKLRKTLVTINEPDFPFYHTQAHYLDLYPKDKLVYLTPHCTNDLDKYDPEDIYIIGKINF